LGFEKGSCEMSLESPTRTPTTEANRSTIESFVEKFKKVFLGDDLDGFMKLVDREASNFTGLTKFVMRQREPWLAGFILRIFTWR
jgi:hypothetical protein